MESGIRDQLAQIPAPVVAVDETEEETEPELIPSPVVSDEDDQAPVGPSEGEDAVYQEEPFEFRVTLPPPEEEDREDRVEFPALDDLVKRIPAASLKAMDELFRAKFATVKQIPKKHLKKT